MAGFIQNIIWNSVEGFVDAGKRTAGEYAGNALIKAGDLVENAGRSVGNGIERKAISYGSSLSGQAYQPVPKALPSTARKPAIKRSNSLPAPSKPAGVKSIGPTSKTPIGANKYPGGKQVNGATKRVTSGVGGAKSAVGGVAGGVVGGAQKGLGGVTKGASKGLGGVTNRTTKTLGGVTNGASKNLGGVTSGVTKALGGVPSKALSTTTSTRSTSLPGPYPNPSPAIPSAEKKTPVRPGQPKPFKAPETKKPEQNTAGLTPYPGTNTLPGQASRTPVRQRYTPLPRLGPQVKEGEKMMHIAV